jgi:hypothetical protein
MSAKSLRAFLMSTLNDDLGAKYGEAITFLDSSVQGDTASIEDLVFRAELMMFADSKGKAIGELERIRAKYPESQFVSAYERVFRGFDRNQHVKDFCGDC